MNLLDRTWYNLLVDDSGSGIDGSIWDKAAVDSLMDAVDQALTETATKTDTGTQNDYALTLAGQAVIRWNGASAVTFTGFTNGASGRKVLVLNVTAAQTLKFTNADTNSTAGNRFQCESSSGQILGPRGSALCVYDATELAWRVFLLQPGNPITPTFSAGHYNASGGGSVTVASGDVSTHTYIQRGKVVTVTLVLDTISISGTVSSISVALAGGGFTVAKNAETAGIVFDNSGSVFGVARVYAVAGGTTISVRPASGDFSASANLTYVRFVLPVEVV